MSHSMPYLDPARPPRLLIISHDVVGRSMAGPGIRYWELARVLATQQPVTLIAPQPIDLEDQRLTSGSYSLGVAESLAAWLAAADVVLANGVVLQMHPELAQLPQPLILDLYDPTLLENLEIFRTMPAEQRQALHNQDTQLLVRQLAAGDFFLCATERQRDLYIGALMATGRLGPVLTDADPQMRGLIDVVPFGLSAEPLVKQQPALRGVLPGIAPDDMLLLWTGGLWEWMDPLTLVDALPQVLVRFPQLRLVFLAGQHPGISLQMQMPIRTRERAAALGLLDRHVFFYTDWVPYTRRGDFLAEADIAVSFHRNHLETAYAAIRSRFLDHLWAGLPSVVSDGDAVADLVKRHDLGNVVAPGDVAGLAAALTDLLENAERRAACAQRARDLATHYTWERVVAPLAAFCRQPRRAPDRPLAASAAPVAAPPANAATESQELAQERNRRAQAQDEARNAALQALPDSYRVVERPLRGGLLARVRQLLINQIVRPFVVPLIEQQNVHNAAVVRALDALAENSDLRRSEIYAQFDRQDGQLYAMHDMMAHLKPRFDQAERQLHEVAGRLIDLEESDTSLAERIAALAASDRVEEQP